MRTAAQVLVKAESDSFLAQFDWSENLATGETITSATVTATPATITVGSPTCSGPLVQIRLTGGVGDAVYQIKCVAVTSLGNTKTEVGRLIVEDSD